MNELLEFENLENEELYNSFDEIEEPEKDPVVIGVNISGGDLNLRKTPDVKSRVVDLIPKNDTVRVLDTVDASDDSNEWLFVSTAEGKLGYCMKKFIEVQHD